jgi:glycosyltransferase involved in cell wall biosynthesis
MQQASPHNDRPAVCFVAIEALGALTGGNDSQANGAELQQVLVARALAARGYAVSFVTADRGQGDAIDLDGIRVFKAYRPSAGVRGLRFIHPRFTGLWRAMKRADADVYFQRTRDAATGLVAAFCRTRGRAFVFSVASNANCRSQPGGSRHERALYRYGLARADRVIAQTRDQQRMLWANYGIQAAVVGNCGAEPAQPSVGREGPGAQPRVLWVGRWAPVKRFEMLLDVAARLPGVGFDVVGGPAAGEGGAYARALLDRAAATPNVRLHGRVRHDEMRGFYERADALVCTSSTEGLPNTFIEAWSVGLPVATTFDPDGVVARAGLGVVADDAPGLAGGLARILCDGGQWREMSLAARRHFQRNHTVDAVIDRLEQVLRDVVSARQAGPSRPVPAEAGGDR